jgi:chromosome segregation ATPase
MAETKIEMDEVRDAYRVLFAQLGRRPGLQLMRKQLGKGSFSRIKRLLDQVEAEEYKLTTPEKPLPDPLAKLVTQIYEEIDQAADASVADRSKAFEEAEAEFQKQMTDKDEELAQMKADLAQSEVERGQMEARIQILEQDLQAEQEKTAELATVRDNLQATLEQLEPRIEELKAANIQQTQATEQMRADMAGQIKHAVDALEETRNSHQQQLQIKDNDHQAEVGKRDQAIAELKGQLQGYEGRIEGLKEQVNQARADAERRIEEKGESDKTVIKLEGKIVALDFSNAKLEEENKVLNQKLGTMSSDLSSAVASGERLAQQLEDCSTIRERQAEEIITYKKQMKKLSD